MSNFDVETAIHPTLTNCPDTATASQALTLPDLNEFSLQTLHMSDPIESLGLPTRVENCLKKSAGIKTLKDFSNFPNEKLIKIKNVGLKTQQLLIQLKIKIRRELQNDRKFAGVQGDGGQQKIRPKNMVDLLLSQCRDERACDVIVKRYGLRGEEKQTLEEIGQHYELTRERIRQIQVKALRRMKGAFNTAKQPIVGLIKEALYINDGLLSEEEADLQIPSALEEGNDDGSSVLDLLSDLGWIQSSKIGDIAIYSPLLSGVGLGKIIEKITDVIEKESLGIDLPTLTKKVSLFKRIQDKQFEPEKFVLRYCHIDPRIREINLSNKDYPLFQHYRHSGNFSSKTWVELMRQVLETEQAPLHFTEMANKVNDLLSDKNKQLEVRRAHSLLIEDKTFAHTGIRGTYGLTVWGLRRETTPQLIEECIKKAGFPLHWRQIYNYVSKYKDSKPASIISVLELNQKFQKLDSGVYGLNENT